MESRLLAALAREWLGLTASDQAELARTARRLDGLQADIRGLDRWMVHEEEPAFGFDPGPASPTPPASPQGEPTCHGPFLDWSASALARAIAEKALGPVEVTRAFLDRIAQRDGAVGAFVTVMADQALEQARRAEAEVPRGPLHGVPVALKDLYEIKGVATSAGSQLLSSDISREDAVVVERLRTAGAILIGKTATHEFAYGYTGGPARNPRDPARSPGGSSGGSAAAVAAGMVPIAMGTDTAGSVRIPASCCGVVGLKPTYGRVSRRGIIPLSWSLDHPGPLARTAADAALVLGVIAESPLAVPGPADGLRSIRIGLPADWLESPMEPAVRQAFEHGLAQLRALGAEVVEVEMPPLALFHIVSRILILAEAGAYHAPYLDRLGDYGPDVRSRVELGQYILARDYLLAQRLRTILCRKTAGGDGEGERPGHPNHAHFPASCRPAALDLPRRASGARG